MSRFFVGADQISESEIRIVDAADVKHLTRVLRAAPGERVEISDSAEWEYLAEVARVEAGAVVLRILDKQRFAREPLLRVSLFQGIPRAPKMDVIIQKAVELGVNDVVPFFCARGAAEGGGAEKRTERWRRIAAEAVKQCRRGVVPPVSAPVGFEEALSAMFSRGPVIFPYENEKERSIKDCLRRLDPRPGRLAVVIGPEGGFSDGEARSLVEAGAFSVSLGKTVLRTETAGPAALAMILYELEL
jgi:16S rRNA (uracil1498-N3)-methyltransferase